MKYYIGVDNGVSGQWGVINSKGEGYCFQVPTKTQQDYTKKKKIISRIDVLELEKQLITIPVSEALIILERPLVNPGMFNATLSAVRALEATLVMLEWMGFAYMFIDSKEWQKAMLPEGTKGSKDLKKASLDIGTRLFPSEVKYFKGDCDGLLIAEYCRRKNL